MIEGGKYTCTDVDSSNHFYVKLNLAIAIKNDFVCQTIEQAKHI